VARRKKMATDSGGPRSDQEEGTHVSGEAELQELGYRQELKRSLSVTRTVALAVSDITPVTALLVIAPVVLATAGTGAFWAYLIAGVLAINVALCMAELGSIYPVAGGLYSIVTRVLGRRVGFLALLDYIGQAIFLPASVALGFGTYFSSLFPAVSPNLASFVMMIIIIGLAMLSISSNALITAVFLTLELLLLAALTIVGLANIEQPIGALFDPIKVSPGGETIAVGIGLIFAAVATGLFSYNGYDSAINFSEETQGEARNVGESVLIAALTGILFQVVTLAAVILAAPSLAKLLGSDSPISYAFESVVGSVGSTIVIIGVLIAIFAANMAITLQFARIVYSTGRDRAWPGGINSALTKINDRFNSPWVAVLIVGGLSAVLCLFSGLAAAVTFTAVLIIVLYALIAISALVSRIRQPDLPRPFRMPLWPVPPIIALIGVGVALSQQKMIDLLIVAAIFVVGAIYYVLFLRPRRATHWRAPEASLSVEDPTHGSHDR
jgi:amino acid transporter